MKTSQKVPGVNLVVISEPATQKVVIIHDLRSDCVLFCVLIYVSVCILILSKTIRQNVLQWILDVTQDRSAQSKHQE